MATTANEQEYKENTIIYSNSTSNTAISLNSNGLTLADNILTTPVIVEINQTGIQNGSNLTTWQTLSSLDTALASLRIPPNSSTLLIENTIRVTDGTNTTDITATDITVDTLNYTTLNPPIVSSSNLSDVLTGGNTATNSIILNNSGTGSNVISLLPNSSSTNPTIVLTDGTTTNTIDKNGYTTRNSVQNATHYLNFSDNSATGTGAIQKTAGINCNPSTNNITATTFTGNLTGNADTATTASNANNVAITSSSTNASFYPTFVSSSSGNNTEYVDTDLSYNPSTNIMTFTALPQCSAVPSSGNQLVNKTYADGLVSGTVNVTDTNTNATYYPTFVDSAGTGKILRADIATNPLSYNPSTGVLTATSFSGSIAPSVETITGTTALSATVSTSIVSGSAHTLPLSTVPGMTKTIINNNPTAFSQIITNSTTTGANTIRALTYDPVLNRMYIGGSFTNLNGVLGATAFCYYDFATSTFIPLGTFTGTDVYDIKISGTRVYVTGAFTLINAVANTVRIAYYDTGTSTWNAMGTGLSSGNGHRMLIYSGSLYVTGTYALAGGVANTVKIARWDIAGATWNALSTGITSGSSTLEMVMDGTKLWVGGNFTIVGAVPNTGYLAYWDTVGLSWNGYGAVQYNNAVTVLQLISTNLLYVGGNYTFAGSFKYQYTTKLDTSTLTISMYGVGGNNMARSFIDTDGTLWTMGQAQSIGSAEPPIANSSVYYTAGCWVYYNTTVNNWVPLCQTINAQCMERTGTAGEYWVGGNFQAIDSFYTAGWNSLMRFQKNNITQITTPLTPTPTYTRNNFNLVYKGQTATLINFDNTSWSITGTTPNLNVASGPPIFTY